MTEESKKKFLEKWKEIKIDTATDNARRDKILEVVEPLVGSVPKKVIVNIPEVKTIVGESKICQGCLSSTCLIRRIIAREITGKSLVNRHCRLRKVLLGDTHLLTLLQSKVEKDKYIVIPTVTEKNSEKFSNLSHAN